MSNLVPVFNIIIAAVVAVVGGVIFKYSKFFRDNHVEDRKTETERLEAENARAVKRADDAESDAQRWYDDLISTRKRLFDSEEYVSRLRAQLHSHNIDPFERGN
jgi:hypothetical protein